jgi:uncharacterized protein YdaU (DUF1376 family)
MHFYPHHIGDFIRDTANLTDSQCMAYQRLCWRYYVTEAQITGSLEDLAFSIRSDEKTVKLLLRHYFVQSEEGWTHKRIDKEIAAYRAKGEKARESAAARWNKANSLPTQSDRNGIEPKEPANQEPITKNQEQEKEEKPRKRAPLAFDRPEDVDHQTWEDWLQLRRAKRAPATETVVAVARTEAQKAGMSLDAFLQVWCMRGSQGLQADWLKPTERQMASRVHPASFAKQDELDRHRRWEAMTGQKWPDTDSNEVLIDETPDLRITA